MSQERINAAQELKKLQSRLSEKNADLQILKAEKQQIDAKVQKAEQEVLSLKNKIVSIQENCADPIVSEHAMLRYIERVMGINLTTVKEAILSEKMKEYITQFGSGKFPDNEKGFQCVVRNRVIISVITKDGENE